MRQGLVWASALLVAGCSAIKPLLPRRADVPPAPRKLDGLSPDERFELLRRAQVWQPIATRSLDLRAGPPGQDAFAFEETVPCRYSTEPPSGRTPKFNCTLANGDVVKVKYGRDNGEVYAEVAATRLFWALGFGTDRQYAVRVACTDCPADPWKNREPEAGATRTFDPAIIERKAPGDPIQVRGANKGWEWWELQRIDARLGGAPRAHLDALKLLAVFVQHYDTKDEQQRLMCLPGGVRQDAAGAETCARPFLFTVDLGGSFSRGSTLVKENKFEFAQWSSVPVWEDPRRCIAKLKRSLTGTLGNPRIGEAGRAFLAERLMDLEERQVRDLFVAARAGETGERIVGPEGERTVSVDDWVRAFLHRRAQIVEHRCPE
jgi:hypothetical protein